MPTLELQHLTRVALTSWCCQLGSECTTALYCQFSANLASGYKLLSGAVDPPLLFLCPPPIASAAQVSNAVGKKTSSRATKPQYDAPPADSLLSVRQLLLHLQSSDGEQT